jgi:hypothetical protein
MTESILIAHCGTAKIAFEELRQIPIPAATRTHQPIAHAKIVDTIADSLALRRITVVRQEFAVSPDGMRCFGVLDLSAEFDGCRFSIGFRNSNDKSLRLALTAGARVTVCDNMLFKGEFQPVLAKHSKSLSLEDVIVLGVDKIHKTFDPFARQIDGWKRWQLTWEKAKVFLYDTFYVEQVFSKSLLPAVHKAYFDSPYEVFPPDNVWSLHNAFTAAFKEVEKPIQQFQLTAKFGDYFTRRWG